MREGETCACGCGAPLPRIRSPKRKYLNRNHARRAQRISARALDTGNARGPGAPSPEPSGSPPTCHSRAESTAERYLSHASGKRPPPEPEPPAEPPLPINDPTRELRRRLLAEAEALLALPHVAVVTVDVRAGEVRVLRVGPPGESVVDVLRGLPEIQDAGRAASIGMREALSCR